MSWWQRAKPGDRIVALKDEAIPAINRAIVKGTVYTVHDIGPGVGLNSRNDILVVLEEVAFELRGDELGWPVEFFRPVAPLPASLRIETFQYLRRAEPVS